MFTEENEVYQIKKISDEKLYNKYQYLLLRLLKFYDLTQAQYQNFLLDYLTYIVNRDNLHPIFYRFKHTNHNAAAYTSFWNPKDGATITFDPTKDILEKPKSLWDLTPILNMLEHEIAHNYDFKYFPKTFNPITNPNGKKELTYKFLSYNALTEIFAGTEYEKFVEHLVYLLTVTARDEMFAMDRAPLKVQKFVDDAKALAKKLNLNADLSEMQEVLDTEIYGKTEMRNIAKLFFAGVLKPGGKNFNDFKSELNKIYDALITNNFDSILGITPEKKNYILKNKPFIIYLQDMKVFYDQNFIDKLFAKHIASDNIFVLDILLLTNLHYNKNAKKQLEMLFKQAQKDQALDFVKNVITKTQNTLPFSRTPINHYKQLLAKYNTLENEK